MTALNTIKTKIHTHLRKNPIRNDVLGIAWPVLLELLLGTLFGMIDMMMLGKISDLAEAKASMSAVGITNQPLFIGLSLVQALNVGGTAMIARYIGAKEPEKIENTFRHVLLLNLFFFAIPLSILGIAFTDHIMVLMGAEQDTILFGSTYFKIIMVGFIFQAFNSAITAALRGAGDTKLPMKVNIFVNFLNVIGNFILIYGFLGFPRLGVTGAGLSTAFSHLLASAIMFYYILRGGSIIKIRLKCKFKLDRTVLFNLVKVGVPASVEQLTLRLGLLLFVRIVASLGTTIFAAHQICLSILGLSFNPGQSFGIAASSLVGRSLGAKEPDRAEDYARETRRIGSLISSGMALMFFVFGPQLVGLYTSDPEIIDSASKALKIIALVQPFQSSQLILAGGLRGAGDTVWPLVGTFVGVLGIRSVLAFIFVIYLNLGLSGAWMAVLVDQLVRWLIVYLRFNTGKWKHVTIR